MDAILPASMLDDDFPSGFAVIGHVGTLNHLCYYEAFNKIRSISPPKFTRQISSV